MAEMSGAIRFVDSIPPAKRGKEGQTKHKKIANQLMKNPNQWGIISQGQSLTTSAGLVNHINGGKIVAYEPKGAFEAASRKDNQGVITVYARYCGEKAL